jgi:uncharacterized protein YqgC (DUF456 family)
MSVAGAVNAEAGRHVIAIEFVTAASAELVSGADGAEAVSAACGELVIALRAKVEITLHVSAAGWAF